ncbi:SNF2 family N-terminal domain-containing protein [Trichoderma evansii]
MQSLFSRRNEDDKVVKDEAKAGSTQNPKSYSAALPIRGIFEQFRNKNLRPVSGRSFQESEFIHSNHSKNKPPKVLSSVTVKAEDKDTGLEQTGLGKYAKMQEAKAVRGENLVATHTQDTARNPVLRSLLTHSGADSHDDEGYIMNKEEHEHRMQHDNNRCVIIKSPPSDEEEEEEEEKEHILHPIGSTLAEEEADGKSRCKRSSEKKRKRKLSKKRSKSYSRSKRSKLSENISSDDGQADTEGLDDDDDEESEDEFGIKGIRAKFPKDLSVRHEATQKEELREGKRLFQSKRFKKMMLSELKPHQVTVTSWMVKRERDKSRLASGGIIGDEMGLGKTVTSLACIAANRLKKKDRKSLSQATLVVVPNRMLATQWLDEAKKHWHEDASSLVTIYDSANHGSSFAKHWIVLATYAQIRHEFRKREKMADLERQHEDNYEASAQEFAKKANGLFQINWIRVILDEAHSITRCTGLNLEVCCAIKAQHRWALTGSAIANKPMEFYPYTLFTKCYFIGGRQVFRNDYIDGGLSTDEFDTVVSYLMYRRTAEGRLNIPETTHQDIIVPVSQEEDIFCSVINASYDRNTRVYKESKEKALVPIYEQDSDESEMDGEETTPSILEEESLNKKTECPRVRPTGATKQLRIRQVLSHPYCLENFLMGKDYLNNDEVQALVSKLQGIQKKRSIIEQLEAGDAWKTNLGQYSIGIDALKDRDEPFFGGVFDMTKILDKALLQRIVETSNCGKNNCPSQDLSRFKCGHIFCSTCFTKLTNKWINQSEGQRTGTPKCSIDSCGQELLCGQPVVTLEMMAATAKKNKSYMEMGRDALNNTVQAKLEEPLFFMADSSGPLFTPPPSARVTATMAIAITWLSQAPQDKIIIFTQFIPTLKILGYLFECLGVRFIYFSGTMPKHKQEQAINAFRNDPTVMVMISTLKTGGQSHNLTIANRVILIDPWWNKTAEKQAIGRVVRIGQKKKTYAVRIMTNHCVDERVIALQTTKAITVDRMLQDDGHDRVPVGNKRFADLFTPKVEKEEKKKSKR